MAVSASAQRPTDFCIDTDYKTSRQTTHNSQLTIHVSPLTSHVSRLTSHVSRLTSHVSRFTSQVSFLFASCPHAASMSFPRLRLTVIMIPLSRIFFANLSTTLSSDLSKGTPETGLYSITFTRTGNWRRHNLISFS